MKQPTYNEVIQEFHRQTIFHKTGSYPRPIVNFELTKYNKDELLFKRFITKVTDSYGHIDWKLMIEALSDFFKGYFNPMYLSNQKGIKIYRNYLRERENIPTDNILFEVKRSAQNVIKYVRQNDLRDVDAYLTEGQLLLPLLCRHSSAGTISHYFLAIIPDIKSIINSFPKDMKDEYFNDFLENYDLYRAKVIKIPALRGLIDNFYNIMNKKIDAI